MEHLYTAENTSVTYNRSNKTISIEWREVVPFEEFKASLEALSKKANQLQQFNIILNLEKVKDMATETQVWFQNDFIINDGSTVLSNANKLAFVKPNGMAAKFIADSLIEWCLRVCPELRNQQFDNFENAENWLGLIKKPTKNIALPFISVLTQVMGLNFS